MRKGLIILAVSFAVALGVAQQASATASGQCNPAHSDARTVKQLLDNWRTEGVLDDMPAFAKQHWNYRPGKDGPFVRWVKRSFYLAQLAHAATFQNFGCRNGHIFGAGMKTMPKGSWVFSLRSKRVKRSDQCGSHHAGCERHVRGTQMTTRQSCSNPAEARILIFSWEKIPKGKVIFWKDALDIDGKQLSSSDPRVAPNTFKFRAEFGGKASNVVYKVPIRQKLTMTRKCTVGEIVTGSEYLKGGWNILSANPQQKRCTKRGIVFRFINQVCPPDVPAWLVVTAKKGRHFVRLPSNVWTYNVSVDGGTPTTVTNRRGGLQRKLGMVPFGHKVTVTQLKLPPSSPWHKFRPRRWTVTRTAGTLPITIHFNNKSR